MNISNNLVMSKMYFVDPAIVSNNKRLLSTGLFSLFILISIFQNANGTRIKRIPFVDEDTIIRTEEVDRNNQTILRMFNLTEAKLNDIYAQQNAKNKNATSQPEDSFYFRKLKENRVNDIRNRLHSALLEKSYDESQEHPLHEIAFYPVCSSEFDESSWLHDNNITIRFSDTLFEPKTDRLNLDSAILRLYKINPNFTSDHPNVEVAEVESRKNKRCAEPVLDTQIRVTVSIVQQLRRNKQRKKRICNTVMMNSSTIGWVEIDIKRAIYIWETVEKQQNLQQMSQTRQPVLIGWLMIEVHDEEERPLKPGLYFNPPKCEEAGLAIPWNFYRPQPSMSSYTTNEVPRYPRLDVKLIGYAAFAPRNYNKLQQQELSDNIRRQLSTHPKSSIATDVESTTNLTPTADNSLESSVSTELLHNHRKRHSRHYHHEIPAEQHTHANHHRKQHNDHPHHLQHDRYLHAQKVRQEPQQQLEKVDC